MHLCVCGHITKVYRSHSSLTYSMSWWHVFPKVLVQNELLYVWCMHLVPLILALNKNSAWVIQVYTIVKPIWSSKASCCSVHSDLLCLLLDSETITKINPRNVLEIMDKIQALRTHHFLITWTELKPGVSENVFYNRSFLRSFLEYL